jgi:hypothetical protein
VKQIESLQHPDDNGDHYNSIKNALDRSLHGDEVYQPQQHAYYGEGNNKSDERHVVFSTSVTEPD